MRRYPEPQGVYVLHILALSCGRGGLSNAAEVGTISTACVPVCAGVAPRRGTGGCGTQVPVSGCNDKTPLSWQLWSSVESSTIQSMILVMKVVICNSNIYTEISFSYVFLHKVILKSKCGFHFIQL